MLAILPQGAVVRISSASMPSPTLSIAPPQAVLASGPPFVASLSRPITRLAPRPSRYSSASGLLLTATTSKPSPTSKSMAKLPTPPVAPVTAIGPWSGSRPFSCRRWIARAAVKPAVPSAMAVKASRPAGRGMTVSAGTRTYAAKPPSRSSERPQPVTSTGWPTSTPGASEAATVPATSMPPTNGSRWAMGAEPVPAMASL